MCQHTSTTTTPTDRLLATMRGEQAEMQHLSARIEQRLEHLDAALTKQEAAVSCYQQDGEPELSREERETRRSAYEMSWM